MDRNTITGILLIACIMIGWMYFTAPTEEERKRQQRYNDSIAQVARDQEKKYNESLKQDTTLKVTETKNGVVVSTSDSTLSDSAKQAQLKQKFGPFVNAVSGRDSNFYIENELIRATVSKKGGRISSVELKNYKRFDSTALVLFDADSSSFGIELDTDESVFNTKDFYFEPVGSSFSVSGDQKKTLAMRLNAGNGKYIEYQYTLAGNSYLVDFNVNLKGMKDVLSRNIPSLNLRWSMYAPRQEFDRYNQRRFSTTYFKYTESAPDYIYESSNETKTLDARVEWIAFKQQFFTAAILAKEYFDKTGADLTSINEGDSSNYIKSFATNLAIPYDRMKDDQSFAMQHFFGPNQFQLLKSYDRGLEKVVPLGWGIFGWVNRFLVIPIFNFLDSFNLNYGIIILILTIIIKILLFPVAYKTYMSSAKMRVLKPEIDEITEKYKDKDPMEKQQATMALYRKAGVNPLAGCIPVLLQMPILIALVSFFPSSIELRQQPFLWADDLSTYDSIWDFGKIPFIYWAYGDHVSLFALLMTASTVLYTWSNSQLMGTGNQLPGMKFMMYAMPFLFLSFLNSNSAGLSYYYFLANMITFGQTWLMRKFIDEEALHRKIQENKKKPVKKSKFQERLEAMQKERMKQMQKKK